MNNEIPVGDEQVFDEPILIYRQRVVEYDITEYIELTPEEYAKLVEKLTFDLTDHSVAQYAAKEIDETIDSLFDYEWQEQYSDTGDDRVIYVWLNEG